MRLLLALVAVLGLSCGIVFSQGAPQLFKPNNADSTLDKPSGRVVLRTPGSQKAGGSKPAPRPKPVAPAPPIPNPATPPLPPPPPTPEEPVEDPMPPPEIFGQPLGNSFVIAVDRSGSMRSKMVSGPYDSIDGNVMQTASRIDVIKGETARLINQLDKEDLFALISFGSSQFGANQPAGGLGHASGSVTWFDPLVSGTQANKDASIQEIRKWMARGGTPAKPALQLAAGLYGDELDQIVFLCDGLPNNPESLLKEFPKQFEKLAKNGCKFIAIHIGTDQNAGEFMKRLADSVGGTYINVQ